MSKTWNMTRYRDGKPFSGRRGVSQRDALTQMYFMSRTGVPLDAGRDLRPTALEADIEPLFR